MKELIEQLDRTIEQLQVARTKLRLVQAEENRKSPSLVNHTHGPYRFHDHLDTESTGQAHQRAHDIKS